MPRPRIFPLTKTESEKMILRDVSFKNDFRETSLKFDLDVFADGCQELKDILLLMK